MISHLTLMRLTEQNRAAIGGLNRRVALCQICAKPWPRGRVRSLWFDGSQIGFICKLCCPTALQKRLWSWQEEL